MKTPNTAGSPPSQNASHLQRKQQTTQGQRPHAVGTQKSVVSPARFAADNEICDALFFSGTRNTHPTPFGLRWLFRPS